MFIQAFPSGPFETNAYIVACEETLLAAVIDPSPDSLTALIHTLQAHQFTLVAILLTHSHWDHIADVAALKKYADVPVLIHHLDAPNLEKPGADKLPCRMKIEGVHPDRLVQEGEVIDVGSLKLQVIETPGHTPGGICFYSADYDVLFTGDTLFQGTIGSIAFPTARPKLMWDSLDKLSKLPRKTRVFPGHGPATTIGEEEWLPNARTLFGKGE